MLLTLLAGALLPTPALPAQATIPLQDSGFEQGGSGWTAVTTTDAPRHAAPEGRRLATRTGSQGSTLQATGHVLAAGEVVTLTGWVRSVNPPGASRDTRARLSLRSTDGQLLASTTADVDAPELAGSAAGSLQDDGVNIWIDGGYRMHFADSPAYQPIASDPILDPWTLASSSGYDFDMAIGPIKASSGLRALYDTYYEDGSSPSSLIALRQPTPGAQPPDYTWDPSSYQPVLEHLGSESPWCIDAQLFEDVKTGRLWMAWGGHVAWITELDPVTGRILGNPASPRFSTHPPGTHTRILCWPESPALGGDPAQPAGWCGDVDSTCYMEGAALYEHEGWWYAFGTYGNLGADYTIRMGRASEPRGPYVDKDGVGCTIYDPALGRYGASMLLAGEGLHTVPGHPHLWREGARHFLGYDRRTSPGNDQDRMAIRELRFVDGWPTIWEPVEVRLVVDEVPGAVGRTLQVGLSNTGDASSIAAFDGLKLVVEGGCGVASPVCDGMPNSAGPGGATLEALGSASLGLDDLSLRVAGGPPGRFGLLFAGHGVASVPLGDGVLCLGAPLQRVRAVQLDAQGEAQLAGLLQEGPLAGDLQAGDSRGFQLWYRDATPAGMNLSAALELTFCP